MRDPKTGYSYGYGFVEYVNPDDSDKAIAKFNGLAVQNKKLKVAYARPPGQDVKDTNVYVQNLPRDIDESYLKKLFSPFGEIINSHLLRDKYTGLLRGVGFVRFAKHDDAKAAIDSMNGIVPEGGTVALNVKVAENHTKKNQQKFMNNPALMSELVGMTGMGGMTGMTGMYGMAGMGAMGNMGGMGNMSGVGAMGHMGGMGAMGATGSMGDMGGMGAMSDMGRMGGMGNTGGSGVPSLMGSMGGGYGGGGMGPGYGGGAMRPGYGGGGMGLAGSMPMMSQEGNGFGRAAPQRNSWQKASNIRPRNRFNPMGRAV